MEKLKLIRILKKNFKDDDTKFLLVTGLKFSMTFLIVILFVIYIFWIMISLNNIFFESNSFLGMTELRSAYLDFMFGSFYESIWWISGFFLGLFITGIYIGRMLLRPFEIIGNYAEEVIENISAEFQPDPYSDFKVLNRFSEFFFRYLDDCRKKEALVPNSIPPQFSKIHKPVFDRVFFLHFAILMIIVVILVSGFVFYASVDVYSNIVTLAISNLKAQNTQVRHFLGNQQHIFNSLQYFSVALITLTYSFMAFHLYSKVSGAAFGFFATMRGYMKGNYFARVHLLEYNHVRPYGRMLNKYLDYMQKNFS
jgi:hypothetical protein